MAWVSAGFVPSSPPGMMGRSEPEDNDDFEKRMEEATGGSRPTVESGGAGYKRDRESGEVAGFVSRQTNGPSSDRRQS